MAEKGPDGPSLELPSFGRRRRKRRPPAEPATPVEASQEVEEPVEAAPEPAPDPGPEPDRGPDPEPGARRGRRRGLSSVGTGVAMVVTGLLTGALVVGLTWASLHLCELVQGTSSCGNPGVFLLLAVLVLAVLLGRVLLAAFGVADAGSISFLGVGLVAVVALVLTDLLFHWWMIVVVPLVAVVAFALAHWVTTAFVEPTEDWMHR